MEQAGEVVTMGDLLLIDEDRAEDSGVDRLGISKAHGIWRRLMRVRRRSLVVSVLIVFALIVMIRFVIAMAVHKSAEKDSQLGEKWNGNYKGPRLCSQLPIPEVYWQLHTAGEGAYVEIPNPGRPVEVGESVCVRVIVPPKPYQRQSLVYMPVPGTPWDSIMLDLVGKATGISVPVRLQPVVHVNNYQPGEVHIYEADVVLRDVDHYRPTGYIEYRNAMWNSEGNNTRVEYEPEPLEVPVGMEIVARDRHQTSRYSLKQHLALPLCTSLDAEGRWVDKDSLPFDGSLVAPSDNHNRVWLPYHCRLQRYSYRDIAKCLSTKRKLLHWYGDSNTRRALKKITSKGQWCSNPEEQESRACLCEDYMEPFDRFNEHAREVVIDLDEEDGGRGIIPEWLSPATPVPGNRSRIVFFKSEGLTYLNVPAWQQRFELGITSRFGSPDSVIISLVNWDAAFMTLHHFAIELDKLVSHVEQSYSDDTDIIIRTGQYFCCRSDDSWLQRKFTRMRVATMNEYVARVFRERLGDSRSVKVWNVAMIAEHRSFGYRNESTICPSNHARSEMVEIENQILFNGLCNSAGSS